MKLKRKLENQNSLVKRCYVIHAEQMALINAKCDLEGSTMYHGKIKNGKRVPIETPTCTVCNRMLKEAGVYFIFLKFLFPEPQKTKFIFHKFFLRVIDNYIR